jgi:hypothetical protein
MKLCSNIKHIFFGIVILQNVCMNAVNNLQAILKDLITIIEIEARMQFQRESTTLRPKVRSSTTARSLGDIFPTSSLAMKRD